jgi:hypothetical protein
VDGFDFSIWVSVGDLILKRCRLEAAFISSLLEAPLDQLRAEFQSTVYCQTSASAKATVADIQQTRNAHSHRYQGTGAYLLFKLHNLVEPQ